MRSGEWLKQAEYDMKTADAMFDAKRYIYVVFMCHLAIEKALKGLYMQILKELPPKTHNLLLLVEKSKVDMPEDLYEFVVRLNGVSVPTRYPEDIEKLKKDYSKKNTGTLLETSKGVLKWLRRKLEP
jgi:HEPN domain-containing protein